MNFILCVLFKIVNLLRVIYIVVNFVVFLFLDIEIEYNVYIIKLY